MNSILAVIRYIYKDIYNENDHNIDPQLVKYFKTEFGSSWKLELDKHILKSERIYD